MTSRAVHTLLCLALALPAGGCIDGLIYQQGGPMGMFLLMVGATPVDSRSSYKRATRVETDVSVDLSAAFGGEDGTYDITLSDPEGGEFGTFTGTASLKRGRIAHLKDRGSPELLAAVEALVEKALGEDVTITSAKARVKAWQTPGGVEASYRAKVKFRGTVDSGPDAGARIKRGKIGAGETWSRGR